MRDRRRMVAVGAAGLFALVTSGAFLARAQETPPRAPRDQDKPAQATRAPQEKERPGARDQDNQERANRNPQDNERAAEAVRARQDQERANRNRPDNERPDRPARRPEGARDQAANVSHDTYMLIAHSLGMAIEASTLQALADQAGAPAPDGQRDAAAQLRQHARAAFAASDQLFRVASQEIGGAARSGQESGEDRGRGADSARRAANAANANERDANQADPSRRAANAANANERDANQADPSRRGAGARAGGDQLSGTPAERFSTAANAYASTLRRFSPEADQAGADANRAAAPRGQEADKASVALINHAVCEVLGGFKLQHMIQMSDSPSAESRALLRHAQQMAAEGRQALQQFAAAPRAGGSAPATAPAAAGSPAAAGDRQDGQFQGAVQTLARQAHEIVRSIDDLGQAARQEQRQAREGRAVGAEDRNVNASPAATNPDRPNRNQDQPDRNRDRPDRTPDRQNPNQPQPERNRPPA